jgi:hypothetical protein
MTQLIKVTAKFVDKKSGKPVTGERYIVKLYDHDLVSDDLIGEGKPNSDGVVEILADLGKAVSPDSPVERKPDILFELFDEDGVIFQSPVFKDIEFLKEDEVTGRKSTLTHDFGTFEF